LSAAIITRIRISDAWLDRTRLTWEQLGGAIGEDLAGEYGRAKRGYLILKQNFDDLGDYDAASQAYRKERRMEKLEARQKARTIFAKHKWRKVTAYLVRKRKRRTAAAYFATWRTIADYCTKYIIDQCVELICDYGEGIRNVVISLAAVWIGFALIYWVIAGVWGPWQDLGSMQVRHITRNPIDLFSFSLGAMVTLEPSDLEARSILIMRILMPLEALLGIFFAGLLGFVVGNRIRRS
jgi:hypothetical protein